MSYMVASCDKILEPLAQVFVMKLDGLRSWRWTQVPNPEIARFQSFSKGVYGIW